jgi:hypothetical protein
MYRNTLEQEKILGGKYPGQKKSYFYQAAKYEYGHLCTKNKRRNEKLISSYDWFEEKILINDQKQDDNPNFNIVEILNKLPIKTQVALRMLYWKNKSRICT